MARPGLLTHRKFAHLASLLHSEGLAMGHLEILWHGCYESGDPILGNSDAVEHLARWRGRRGRLTAALLESGFIEQDGDQFRVHDLYDHAPIYVRKRMEREEERRKQGRSISDLRANAGRKGVRAKRLKRQANGQQMDFTCVQESEKTVGHAKQTDTLPSPAPAPAPAPNTSTQHAHPTPGEGARAPIASEENHLPGIGTGFEAFWNIYPCQVNKLAARTEWEALNPQPDLRTSILAALERHKASEQWRRGVIPHAVNWLRGRRWEDRLPAETAKPPPGAGRHEQRIDEAIRRGMGEDDDPG